METMNRILPDELVAMYRAENMRPLFNETRRGNQGCGVACYAAAHGDNLPEGRIFRVGDSKAVDALGWEYSAAFGIGFDGKGEDMYVYSHWFRGKDMERAEQGYLDGQACRAAVLAIDWDAPLVELSKVAVVKSGCELAVAK